MLLGRLQAAQKSIRRVILERVRTIAIEALIDTLAFAARWQCQFHFAPAFRAIFYAAVP